MKGGRLIEHHTHYKEIDGYDETIFMTMSEHVKLHQRLRKEGKCNIPVEEMTRIAAAAHRRTDKHKKLCRDYYQRHINHITFYETPGPNISLRKIYRYNYKTGAVTCTIRYVAHKGHILPVIDIGE